MSASASAATPTVAELQAQLAAVNQQNEKLNQQKKNLDQQVQKLSEKVDSYRTCSMNQSDTIREFKEDLDAAHDQVADLQARNDILVHDLDAALESLTLSVQEQPSGGASYMPFRPKAEANKRMCRYSSRDKCIYGDKCTRLHLADQEAENKDDDDDQGPPSAGGDESMMLLAE